jgi:DNA-binding XRE family transcriptional regulator
VSRESLRSLRERAGLSKAAAAERVDMHRNTITRLEATETGHNAKRYRKFLESLAPATVDGDNAGSTNAVKGLIASSDLQPTAFHDFAALLARTDDAKEVAQALRDTYNELAEAIPDPQLRLERAVSIVVKVLGYERQTT